jgi:hypothetical protein
LLTIRQDVLFGSEGTAQADFERMEEINREIGLAAVINDSGSGTLNTKEATAEKGDD